MTTSAPSGISPRRTERDIRLRIASWPAATCRRPTAPPSRGSTTSKASGTTRRAGRADGVELAGKRVGIIGTGSTGIQLIPQAAAQAAHVYVFQRTPNFSMPAHNRPLDPDLLSAIKADYRERRRLARESLSGVPSSHPDALPQRSALEVAPEERARAFEHGWAGGGIGGVTLAFNDIIVNAEANGTAADFVRGKIREIVHDPATAEALCPTTHPIGTKRICVDTDYYATYNRANVTLVDVRSAPIVRLTPRGIETTSGDYELDVIVFATGFDAMTGPLLADRRARARGPPAGGQVVGRAADLSRPRHRRLPQPLHRDGPGQPFRAEQHGPVDRAACRLDRGLHRPRARARARPRSRRRATPRTRWVAHVNEVAQATLFPRARSWYIGANIPGKPRVFMPYLGGVGNYRAHCDGVAAGGYAGFAVR